MNNRLAFIDITVFNNNSFFFSSSLSTEGYKTFFLFFEKLVSTVDNTVDRFIIKFNIFSELLFLRRLRRVNEFSIDIVRIITLYIFYNIFIVFRTATLSTIYSDKKL